ncbi:MAG: methylmalonyl-CoA mutase family protein, partial [Candidatus Poseidoniaceae archaeon]|nr:methylmalonyl-CoA mutase family protein [Candidatus Poseidoniaceae archaeon]
MLDVADIIVLNKYEKRGSEDALRAIRKQVRRNRNMFEGADEDLPVVATIASQFADPGVDVLWKKLAATVGFDASEPIGLIGERKGVIPPERVHYLSEIASCVREYHSTNVKMAAKLRLLQHLETAAREVPQTAGDLSEQINTILDEVADARDSVAEFRVLAEQYASGEYTYHVRGKPFKVETKIESMSHQMVPRVALPTMNDDGELYIWLNRENAPGHFPFTAGVFPFKRTDELSARMFAGEGEAERTNRRFHLLSQSQDYVRLSTAFDSVTLYGRNPDKRPDIWGKVGNSGVSIASIDDAKRLYSGFDLCDANTSVSMTINGPAPIILAFFLNAAIDQQVERHLQLKADTSGYRGELPDGHDGFGLATINGRGDGLVDASTYAEIKAHTLQTVRGTVQADILKEDQAQN